MNKTPIAGSAAIFPALILCVQLLQCGTIAAVEDDDAALSKYFTGNTLFNKKVYSAAAAEYKDFLTAYPQHEKAEQARLGLALCCYSLGKYSDAEPLLKGLIQNAKAGDQAQLNVLLGQCQLKRNAFAEAEKTFDDGAKAKGAAEFKNAAIAALTDLLFKEKKWAETVAAADRALKDVKTGDIAARAGYQGAFARYSMGKYKDAAGAFEALLSIVKGTALENQAWFLLGECRRELGDLAGAAEAYSAAAKNEKGSFAAETLFRLGFVEFLQKKYDEAAEALGKSLKEDAAGGFSDEARMYLGRAYLEKKSFKESIGNLKLVSGSTNASAGEATLWLGRAYARQNNPAEVVKMFEENLPRFQKDQLLADMLFDYGCAQMDLNKNAEAAAAFARIEKERADWSRLPEALRLHAFCDHWRKDYKSSLSICERFLSIQPTNPMPEVVFLKAENMFLLNPSNMDEVLKSYRDFIKNYPEDQRCDPAALRCAQILHKKGDWAEALKVAAALVKKSPEGKAFSQVGFIAGDCSFRLEAWDGAITNLSEFVKKSQQDEPNLDTAQLELGLSHLKKGNKEAAMDSFSTLISKHARSPHIPLALVELGRLQYAEKKNDGGGALFKRVVDESGDSPQRVPAEYYLGWIELDKKKDAEAAPHFELVLKKSPKDPLAADSLLQLGLMELRADKFAEAQKRLLRYSSDYPDAPKCDEAVYSAGVAMARQKHWDDAIGCFKSAVEKYPKSSLLDRAVYEWAWAERGKNNLPGAIAQYEYLLKTFPKSALVERAGFELAELTFDTKNFDKVIGQLKETISSAREKAVKEQAMYRLGWAHLNKGDSEAAAVAFEALLKEFPQSDMAANAHYQAGECRLKIKEFEAANDHFLAAVKANNSKEVHESALLRLGETQGLVKQWKESAATYAQFQAAYPQSKWIQRARFGGGWAYENLKQYQQALGEYGKVVTAKVIDDLAARSQFQIGECFFALKEYDKALQELARVQVNYSSREWTPQALLEMGRVLETKGDKTAAMTQFREVIQKFPQHEVAVVAKERLDALRTAQ